MTRLFAVLSTGFLVVLMDASGATAASKKTEASKKGKSGISLLIAGRHAEAVKALRAATTLDPRKRRWWINLGWALNGLKRSNEAIAAFNRALRLTRANEYYVMGQILFGLATASENKKDCFGMARHLKKWISLTAATTQKIRNRKSVKDQLSIARQRIRDCPKRAKADRRK